MRQEVKEATQKDKNKEDEVMEVCRTGEVEVVSSGSRYMSLLTSKDRDFLLSPTGTQVKVSDLEGKVIGLYFSANWYIPCRNFTQVLANTYDKLKTSGSEFEVVFVSSDEDLDAFNNYYASMPWLAIPFSDLESKKALNRRFDVEGIPCLIILQPNSPKDEDTLREGVEIVYRYGVGAFPFTRGRLEELEREENERHENQTLLNLLTNHDRDFLLGHQAPKQVPVGSLTGKTVGLYFSAQWCLPGLKFTPKLISIYEKIKELVVGKGNEDFEIVLVSSDRDPTEFDSHFNSMPWLALPFGDPVTKHLTKYFDIQGIPCLVILGPDGKTITKHGRSLVNLYQENAYPFTEAKVGLLVKQMDDEAKNLPRSEKHVGHRHELTLVSEGSGGGLFICCDCDEQGSGWAYQCIECGYEVHPKCVRAVDHGPTGEA
ncbi:Nucleoredoxin like [Actinidia chinensis var. chinensis]|uniref:protein-disulfide reductase n=1 Tax=Actinidia chinensis var. chinensis TaxID=1590841 RepID=A0A2R6RMI4_ACTCC|nr:Nucleoredoxin like [Actinidia chinensis var. chinensis]